MNDLQSSIARWQIVAFVVLALSLAATVAVWRTAESLDRRAAQENFEGQAKLATAQIENRLTAYDLILRSSSALYSGSSEVTRQEWRDYVATLDLDNSYPGVLGLGFVQRVPRAELAAHVADMRAQGFPDYAIRPSGERTEYTSIVYIEPFNERNQRALGFDMMSEDIRRAAMEQARDTGRSAMSGKVELLQEITGQRQPGFGLYLPIYAKGSNPVDLESRRRALRGYVFSPFRASDLMDRTLGSDFPQISVAVYDGREVNDASLLYDEQANDDAPRVDAEADLRHSATISMAGRPWTIVFRPTTKFSEANGQSPAILSLVSGVAISLLLFLLIWNLVTTRQRALRLLQIAEQEREGLEAKFRDLFEFSHDAIVLVDGEGTITDINAQAEATFGYSRSELTGQKIEILVPQSVLAKHVALRDGYLQQPKGRMMAAHLMDIKARRKDGVEFDASVSLTPISSGQQTLVAAGIRDLTEKMATEAQLRQAQKMEAVGNLTGGMAHDFNNLLSVIIGNLDLLDERENPDRIGRELAQEALDAALRGAALIQRLLAFARRQPLEPEACDINEQIRGLSDLLSRTLGENITTELSLGEDIWPVTVDLSQLEASLVNIANNAADAMPTGGRLIIATSNSLLDEDYVSHRPELVAGDYVLIEVSDTGLGMPPEVASRIFEPFFTTKHPGMGTGLGLSMVFGFAKQSGGHVSVYSEVGEGTTIKLFLPRASGGSALPKDDPIMQSEIGGHETILVVEDKEELRKLVTRQLTELGYRVLEAEHGGAALTVLESNRVDLMFSDIVMPGGLSGYDLAKIVQKRWPDMKVMLTSGFPDLKFFGDADQPSNLRMLKKPYRKADLANALRAVLDS